jgi:hypothetical protein
MVFGGVEAFRCTYYQAVSVDIIKAAYDRVIDFETTDWLSEIVGRLKSAGQNTSGLRHLIVYFDDGPCYEFICREFRVETDNTALTALPTLS